MTIVTKHYNYSEGQVRRKGTLDGRCWRWRFWPFLKKTRAPFPPADRTEHALFEQELAQAAESAMGLVATEWRQDDVELEVAWARAASTQRSARESSRKESAESEQASKEYDDIRSKFFAVEPPAMNEKLALLLLSLFGFVEALFNGVVFQLFGEKLLFTWLIALGIGFVLPFLGHYTGKTLRQERKSVIQWSLMGCADVIAVSVVVGVAAMRGVFLETSHARELLGYSMSVGTARAIFFLFNLALFFAAVVLGHVSTHADEPLFKQLRKRYRHALAKKEKEGGEAAAAARFLAEADVRVRDSRTRRERRFILAQETARFIKEKNDWFITVYREANATAREGGAAPPCFSLLILSAEIPASLVGDLDWPEDSTPAAPSASEAKGALGSSS